DVPVLRQRRANVPEVRRARGRGRGRKRAGRAPRGAPGVHGARHGHRLRAHGLPRLRRQPDGRRDGDDPHPRGVRQPRPRLRPRAVRPREAGERRARAPHARARRRRGHRPGPQVRARAQGRQHGGLPRRAARPGGRRAARDHRRAGRRRPGGGHRAAARAPGDEGHSQGGADAPPRRGARRRAGRGRGSL
ncbi:MAG: RND efflux system, membrane fusion protein, partial [uncultured Gemmatimonadaceae bacterium]